MWASELRDLQYEQKKSDQDQGHAGDPLSPLPNLLAKPGAEPQPDLRRHEGLDADPQHRQEDRQPEQARAQPDRQLVDADAEAEVEDGQAASVSQEAQPATFVTLLLTGAQQGNSCQE